MVATTTGNREGYTNRYFLVATESQEVLVMMGNISPMDYINMVCSSMLHNCPVTPEDLNNANSIFVMEISSLKGKTVSKYSDPLVTEYMEITQAIIDLSKKVTLASDVMFVNGLAFFISMSRRITFPTLEYITKRTKVSLIGSINKFISIYNTGCFNIRKALMGQGVRLHDP